MKQVFGAIFAFCGAWLIIGTFAFHVMPAWAIVLHMVCAIAYIGLAPMIIRKLGVE